MYPTICIEGLSCIGKTSTVKDLEEKNKKVAYVDLTELSKKESKYLNKHIDPLYNIFFALQSIIDIENTSRDELLYSDRSPLASIFYNHIYKLMTKANLNNLYDLCVEHLSTIFPKPNEPVTEIQSVVQKLLDKFTVIIFNTKDIDNIAGVLFQRKSDIDLHVAKSMGYNFDMNFCKWYTKVQCFYFAALNKEFNANIKYFEIDNYDELMKHVKAVSKVTTNEFLEKEELYKMSTFHITDKKLRKKVREFSPAKNIYIQHFHNNNNN